jgi:RNA recognition motif-containing protein
MSADGVKLFVYGVSASCPRGLLEKEFGKCGRVNDIFNTGKGFAFITMADERDAKIAVEDLNGQTVDGQEIKVEISHGKGSDKPGRRDDRGGRDRRDGRRGGGRDGGRDRYSGGGGRDFGRRYCTVLN